ncbi:hypothetical protein TcBrA4_0124570 [Trypanosoma cruzi]|nr:hypothetical protein TcBrA4_0124570 [Trypanosoma cruzi]
MNWKKFHGREMLCMYAALEEVESAPIDVDAKQFLQRYVTAANVGLPVFLSRVQLARYHRRVCLTTIEVSWARAPLRQWVAVNKDASQRRAAMHALALLRRIEPTIENLKEREI